MTERLRTILSPDRLAKNLEKIEYYTKNPVGSFFNHVRNKKMELADSISAKRKVYLDTKFWIILDDISRGILTTNEVIAFYDLLRKKVEGGKIICPISMDVFLEVMKQTDPSSRARTFAQIEIFSQGISVENYFDAKGLELQTFFGKMFLGADKVHPIQKLIWTKIPYTLGLFVNNAPPENGDAINKAFFDLMWEISPTEMDHLLPDDLGEIARSPGLAEGFNIAKMEDHDPSDTFDSAFMKFVTHDIAILGQMDDMFTPLLKLTGYRGEISRQDFELFKSIIQNTLTEMIRSGKISKEIPSITALSGLHTAIRLQKGRKYKDNDLPDITHATSALGYFDFFFTERSLRHLITTKPLKYDKLFGTEVADSIPSATEILSSIV